MSAAVHLRSLLVFRMAGVPYRGVRVSHRVGEYLAVSLNYRLSLRERNSGQVMTRLLAGSRLMMMISGSYSWTNLGSTRLLCR